MLDFLSVVLDFHFVPFLQILGLLGCLLLLSNLILEIFIERIFHKVIKVTAIGGGSHHWGIEEQSKEFF